MGVDAVVEEARSTLQAAGVGVHGVNDLVGSSNDTVGGGEGERECIGLLAAEAEVDVEQGTLRHGVAYGRGLGQGREGQESDGVLHGARSDVVRGFVIVLRAVDGVDGDDQVEPTLAFLLSL